MKLKRAKASLQSRFSGKPTKVKTRRLQETKRFPIVGIGASAGGFEAFREMLDEIAPDCGVAFVLIQHLDPHHESQLHKLLAQRTRLTVAQVKRPTLVEPNHLYLIPPNKNLVISKGRLLLSNRQSTELPNMPIDQFLRSLAEDQGANGLGVILSGNGSDGTLGIEAIKGADGLTFAQDPSTAKFVGMPQSAISSGCVDFILSPSQLGAELTKLPGRILHHDLLPGQSQPHQNSDPLGRIYAMLRAASHVDFSSYKQSTLKRRILRRMVVHHLEKIEDYVRHLHENGDEVKALFDDMLITVTRFFRDPASLQVLTKKVFPALISGRRPDSPIRIWVPGCSTGEEAYSLAICLMEYLSSQKVDFDVQIFGTDINETAVVKARAGVYRANIAQDVSPARLRRFFTQVDEGFRISKLIRDMCVFARQNLGADPPFSELDLISCQNVLIYFGPEMQRQVMPVFHYALKANGYLLLSSAESVGGFSELFTQVDKRQRLYAKAKPLVLPEVTFNSKVIAEEKMAPGPELITTPAVLPNIEKTADRLLLHYFTPSGVIIDSKMQVLQFRGQTANYLEHVSGTASLNLLKMAPEDLGISLRTAIAKALKEHRPVVKEVTWTHGRGHPRSTRIEVVPFKVPPAKEQFVLVLFEEFRRPEPTLSQMGKAARVAARESATGQAGKVTRLRDELETTRASLQAIIEELEASNEELKSANEEIQSANEELQSTNEELETAKEELQSTNEELSTVNDELQHTNQEANRVNNDLINLLASVQIPVVMVDSNLIVRRFTPSAQKFFNLIPTDIGRSINDIKVNVDVTDLDQMIYGVIETLHLKEVEVKDRHGQWYSLRIRPYRTKDNKIEGAVLALLDIDGLRRCLDEMSEVTGEPLVVLDRTLRVTNTNEAFRRKFNLTADQCVGKLIYELNSGRWNIPRLRSLLEEVLPDKKRVMDYPIEHDFPKLRNRRLLLHARRLEASEKEKEMIFLAVQDVTDQSASRA